MVHSVEPCDVSSWLVARDGIAIIPEAGFEIDGKVHDANIKRVGDLARWKHVELETDDVPWTRPDENDDIIKYIGYSLLLHRGIQSKRRWKDPSRLPKYRNTAC